LLLYKYVDTSPFAVSRAKNQYFVTIDPGSQPRPDATYPQQPIATNTVGEMRAETII
jgi:hypothetical protein